jgi:transporter family-2 protein
MVLLLLLLAFCIGMGLPLQAAINSSLRDTLRSGSVLAALVSFSVGTVALAAMGLLTGQPFAALAGLPRIAWWQWVGGCLGATFIFGSTMLAPRIGLAAMTTLIVAGQVVMSLAFDRFGWLGIPVRGISWIRLTGAVLLLAGAVLVNFGERWLART